MAELGSLFYNLHIRDFTDAEIQNINDKLKKVGSSIQIDGNAIRSNIESALANNPVKISFDPHITAKDIEAKLTGQVVNAEIKPLVGTLASSVSDALKGHAVNLDTFVINPDALNNAVRNALVGNGFTAFGDAFADAVEKSVKTRFDNSTYTAKVQIDIKKLADSVKAGLEQGEKRGVKINTANIKSDIEKAIKSGVKLTFDPQISVAEIESKLTGKVVRAEIVPLAGKLRQAITDAAKGQNGQPFEIAVGPKASLLQRLVTQVLTSSGYMININTVTGLAEAIRKVTQGQYHVTLTVDPRTVAQSLQSAMANMQSKTFGLTIQRDILYRSIDEALLGKKFPIQIQVLKDQARMAVQNALNNARITNKDDALAYQRLQTGELKAAQAELARLKAEHQQAANAASAHARISTNLGSVFGSNIRLAGELGSAMAGLYSIHAAKNFLNQVIEIGGELEHQKIALETIYGSESKMESLYSQIKGLARSSPFGVMDLTKNVKQLSAYGVAYNEVYDTAKRLADISAATSVDINRLILAFGKTKNRTFLDGLEAKQFAYANIPIYDALSKKLTELEGKFVSVRDVMGRIKKREIGFDMVKDILWDMTDEGGKFYNMQEKLAGSVKTSWKLVKDNIQLMFGEIAESGVGSVLKDIGVIAQNLTREWKTLGTVLATLVAAFGVSRIAMAANTVMLERNTLASIKSQAGKKMEIYHNNLAAQSYRNLTSEEERNYLTSYGLRKIQGLKLLSRKQLTFAEIEAMMASKALTREELLKLVALKKVSIQDAQNVLITKSLTAAEIAETKAAITQAAAAKRRTVLFTHFRASLAGIGNTMRTLLFNPFSLIMAGMTVLMTLWQRNNEEAEKSKEIGDNLFTKAVEGARELNSTIDEIKPVQGLDHYEILQGIENMENKIKDFSPTPIEDINKALYTQDGLLRPIGQRYEVLKQRLEELKDEFENITTLNLNTSIKDAIDYSNGGWFTDDVNTNAKDYDNALKKRRQKINEYITKHAQDVKTAVDVALSTDVGFAAATANMKTYEQKFMELATNSNKYATGFYHASRKVVNSIGELRDAGNVQGNETELLNDMQRVWNSLSSDAKTKGIESIAEATDEIKESYAITIRDWINSLEVSDETKQRMFQFYSELLKYDFESFDAKQAVTDGLDKGLETEVGKVIAQKIRNGAKLTPEEQNKVNDAIYNVYQKAFETASESGKQALNKAFTDTDKDGNTVWSNSKALSILARLDIHADWEEWQTEIDNATGNLPDIQTWIKGAADHASFIKAVQEGYADSKTTLDKLKPLMIKAGIEFDFGEEIYTGSMSRYAGMSENQKKMIDDYNKMVRTFKAAKKAGETLGFDASADYDKKSKHSKQGSRKDTVAEQFKQRFKDLKDAWSEYQKWRKSIGDDAAADKVAGSGLFGDMAAEDIPRTAEQYRSAVEELKSELEKVGVKGHSQRETLLNDFIRQLLDIDKSMVDENIKNALEAVETAFDREIADWNLYEKIHKATGNERLAYSFSFGMDGGETDYVTLIKKRFAAIAKAAGYDTTLDELTYRQASALGDDVAKAWKKANEDIAKYREEQRGMVADMLSQYQSTQEKIAAIEADAQDKIAKVNADRDLDSTAKQRLVTRIRVQADYDKFTQSNEYLQFFSGIYALTESEATRIGDLIRRNLDEQLQAGAISAKNYYDEISKIQEQLDKIRNVKSNAMTMLTGGFAGINDKRSQENDSRRLELTQRIKQLNEDIEAAREKGDDAARMLAESQLLAARKELDVVESIRQKIVQNQKAWQDVLDVANIADNIARGLSDAFSTVREMADAVGIDTDKGAWDDIQAVLDSVNAVTSGFRQIVQSLMNGDIGGVLSGAVSTLLSPITIWSQLHDKKLQKDIERSQKQYDEYQRMIDAIERRMERFLGHSAELRLPEADAELARYEQLSAYIERTKAKGKMSFGDLMGISLASKEMKRLEGRVKAYREGGALGYERELMREQIAELERQKADMEDMKKKDPEAIAEITAQLDEARMALIQFAEEQAEALYGINLKDWASQLGDALYDAWKKGEDGVKAYRDAVGSLVGDMMNEILKISLIQPMMDEVRTMLFGTDGESGLMGQDFKLDNGDLRQVIGLLMEGQSKVDAYNEAMSDIERYLKDNYGVSMKDDDSDSSGNLISASRNLTEETGGLLASYLNAIRADVSVQTNIHWPRLLDEALPQVSLIAGAQLDQLRMVAENTRRNAVAAEAIQTAVSALGSTMRDATQYRDRGFYIRNI